MIKNCILYTVLLGGAVIVLLPLFWMILTAFKQSGRALDFQFLPSEYAETNFKLLSQTPEGLADLTLEYDPALDPKRAFPSTVTVRGGFNEWQEKANPLEREGNVFVTTIKGLKPGRYPYKFFLNGKDWVEDPGNSATEGGNSVVDVKPGTNRNKALADSTEIIGDSLVLKVLKPDAQRLKAKVSGKIIDMEKDKEGFFSAKVVLTEKEKAQIGYSFLEPQDFWEGMKKIYTLSNFTKVLQNPDFPFGRFFLNSLIVATLTALATVFLCTLAGYAFAKKEFLFKKQLFGVLLSTMLIPGMIFMVPQFALVNNLDWINTYQGMIVPHLANIFGLFLLRQYISTIPHSLFEAAKIDGASELQIFKIIIIPLSLPIMVTLFLLTFMGQWGNFLWQLIVNTPDSTYRTLPVGLALFRGQYGMNWEMMMAGACFSILPIALLFLAAQRVFIEGMTSGAIKE